MKISYEDLNLVGLKEKKAKKLSNKAGWHLRVTIRDGYPIVITRDYRVDRINISVENEIVIEVFGIG